MRQPITKLSPADMLWVAVQLRKQVEQPAFKRHADLFLCGAAISSPNSVRGKLHEIFENSTNRSAFQIHLPEHLFADLMVGRKNLNLLAVENLLARSVDAVLLVAESAGSIAELGAFANHESLREKLIVLVDKARGKDRSFIMRGPVRLISDMNKRRVILEDLRHLDVPAMDRIVARVKGLVRGFGMRRIDISNALETHHFLLMSLYVLESLTRDDLAQLLSLATGMTGQDVDACVASGLRALTAGGAVAVNHDGYSITRKAFDGFNRDRTTRAGLIQDRKRFDSLRTEVLTMKNRGKTMRIEVGNEVLHSRGNP